MQKKTRQAAPFFSKCIESTLKFGPSYLRNSALTFSELKDGPILTYCEYANSLDSKSKLYKCFLMCIP